MPIRSRAVLLIGLMALAGPAPSAAADKARARRYFDEGLELYRRGDFSDSLSALTKAIQEDSGFLPALSARAQVRHALCDDSGAETDSKGALRISSIKHPEDAVARGNARLLSGDIRRAMADFDLALKFDPNDSNALLGRGRAFSRAGDYANAVRDWTHALKIDPNLLLARYSRAKALYDLGRKEKVVEELTRALQENSKFYLPYDLLGIVFAERGDYDRASKAYTKAILLNPDCAFAYIGRAAVRLKQGDARLALNDFDEAVRVAPDDYAPYYNRGEARYRRGMREAALADFRKMLDCRLDWSPAASAAGDRFLENGLLDEAVRMYSRAVEIAAASQRPDAAANEEGALLKRSAAYQALHEDAQAMKDLNETLRISSNSAEALAARGMLLVRTGGDVRKAEEDLHRSLRLRPRYAPALLAEGSLRARLGRPEEALKDFTAAIAAAPDFAEAYNARGAVFANMLHDYERAVEDISKAAELDDTNAAYELNLAAARVQRRDYRKALEAVDAATKLKGPPEQCVLLRAQVDFYLGNRIKAAQEVEDALLKNPRSSPLQTLLGSFRLRSRDFPRAVADLDQGLSFDSKNVRAHLYRGLAYGGMGEYKKALKDFDKAADMDPKSADARAYECEARRLSGEAKDALRACNAAIELDTQHPNALVNRGLAYLALREYQQAAKDLYEANRYGIPLAAVSLARSLAHAALKQYRESDAAYREALAIDYQARLADVNFGEQADLKKEYGPLMDGLEETMSRDVENAGMYVARGNALANAAHFDRAILMYTRAIEIDGNLASAYLERGLALIEQQSYDAAEHDLRRAMDLNIKGPQVHLALLTLLTAQKRLNEGLKVVLEAIRLFPNDPDVYIKAGNLRFFLHDTPRAQENYELALKYDKRNAAAFNGIGLCQFARKEYDAAIENFSRAITLRADTDRFYRNRASAYVNKGDFANAVKDYKMALEVNQDPEMIEEYRKLIQSTQSRIAKQGPSADTPADQ